MKIEIPLPRMPSMPGLRYGVAAVAFLVMACGPIGAAAYDQATSASQILKDASDALKSVTSAHVKVTSSYQGSTLGVDADVEVPGNLRGKITVAGGTFGMIVVGGKVYINGTDLVGLMHISDPVIAAQITAKVGNKWVLLSSGFSISSKTTTPFTDFSGMAACMNSNGNLTKKGLNNVGSDSVVEVDDAAGTKIFVRVASPHYPLRMQLAAGTACMGTTSGSAASTVDLSSFNTHFGITAPKDVVDLSALGLGMSGA
jgi:hypothetical protein